MSQPWSFRISSSDTEDGNLTSLPWSSGVTWRLVFTISPRRCSCSTFWMLPSCRPSPCACFLYSLFCQSNDGDMADPAGAGLSNMPNWARLCFALQTELKSVVDPRVEGLALSLTTTGATLTTLSHFLILFLSRQTWSIWRSDAVHSTFQRVQLGHHHSCLQTTRS